jgi:hypothetical protein
MSRTALIRLIPSFLLACACTAAAVLSSLGTPVSSAQSAIETAPLAVLMLFADTLEHRLRRGIWRISPGSAIIAVALTLAAAIAAQGGSTPTGGFPPILIAAAWIALTWSASDGCEMRGTWRRSP